MYLWSSRDRLCWPRLIWLEENFNYPEYVLHRKYYARGSRLQRYPKELKAKTKCDRWLFINMMPPAIGQYPVRHRWGKKGKRIRTMMMNR